jgi:hypothetical protein
MSTPDPKTVRKIAREAVRRGGSDSGYGFIGSVISDHAAMDEMLASGDRAAFGRLHAAVRAELKGATITVEWPDEQQPADVVTAEQQQDGAAEELRTFLAALPPRIDIVADWTRGGVRNVLTAEALRAVLAERTALAARVAKLTVERTEDARTVDAVAAAEDDELLDRAISNLIARFADRIEALFATDPEES